MTTSEEEHNDALTDLMKHPHKIGLEGVIWVCRNVIVSPNDVVIGEIDLLYYLQEDEFVVGEYKRTRNNYTKAVQQLNFAKDFVKQYYDKPCSKLFIWKIKKGYKHEKIKRDN